MEIKNVKTIIDRDTTLTKKEKEIEIYGFNRDYYNNILPTRQKMKGLRALQNRVRSRKEILKDRKRYDNQQT